MSYIFPHISYYIILVASIYSSKNLRKWQCSEKLHPVSRPWTHSDVALVQFFDIYIIIRVSITASSVNLPKYIYILYDILYIDIDIDIDRKIKWHEVWFGCKMLSWLIYYMRACCFSPNASHRAWQTKRPSSDMILTWIGLGVSENGVYRYTF